ncbi:MAG: hypothetical protein ICV60_09235 [Pyrinomonadaceae bacterium]|nr:hypothetical protein [Pyrinomonadaceae bacterium]
MKKRVVIILSIVVALFALEVGREYLVYRMASNRLEGGYWKLQGRAGLSKEEVRAIAGEPDQVEQSATDENWYWYARNSRGPLWKIINRSRGYELNVQFDKTGRMLDVYSKVN